MINLKNKKIVDNSLNVVTSGHGCTDLIVSDIHKSFAVKKLMDIWNIHFDEIMTFGDVGNDLEMLKLADYGFVMANDTQEMKDW